MINCDYLNPADVVRAAHQPRRLCFSIGPDRQPMTQASKTSRLHFRHPSCYAAPIWGCSTKLSGEHGIGSAVLKVLTSGGSNIAITNHPWQKTGRQVVRIAKLRAKVLCVTHNGDLSRLDDEMARFAHVLFQMYTVLTSSDEGSRHTVHLFSGDDLERWLLKALCASMKSGWLSDGGAKWVPPISWLNTLFERECLPHGSGLSLATDVAASGTPLERSCYFWPLMARPYGGGTSIDRLIVGCAFRIYGMTLTLRLGHPRYTVYGRPSRPDQQLHYRPDEICWTQGDRHLSVRLKWERQTRVTPLTVGFDWVPPDTVDPHGVKMI